MKTPNTVTGKWLFVLFASAALLLFPLSCESPRGRGAFTGALIGAAAGGVIGHNTSLGGWEGAAIGAAVGAASGYVIADASQPTRVESRDETIRENEKYRNYESRAAERRESRYEINHMGLRPETVQWGETVEVETEVTILTPRAGQRTSYGIYYQFVTENGTEKDVKERERPLFRDKPSGTYLHRETLRVSGNIPSGNHKLRVLLVNNSREIVQAYEAPITIR